MANLLKRLKRSLFGSFLSSAAGKNPKKRKATAKSKKKKKPAKGGGRRAGKKPPKPEGKRIGLVTHYFPKVKAGVLKISAGKLALGDPILIKGKTTNFKQKVDSLQIDRSPIETAKVGDEIGLGVKSRVRAGDVVYRLGGR